MVIDFIRTKDKNEALALLSRHLESGHSRYASIKSVEGEFIVGILEVPAPSLYLNFVDESRDETPTD